MAPKGFTNNAIPALSACESPIEGKFIQALFDYLGSIPGVRFEYLQPKESRCSMKFVASEGAGICVFVDVQHRHEALDRIGGGKVDVRLNVVRDGYVEEMVVELDGVDFHSSAESIKRDRLRDRTLLAFGVPVMRFTGSDVYKPEGALSAVLLCFETIWARGDRLIGAHGNGYNEAEASMREAS